MSLATIRLPKVLVGISLALTLWPADLTAEEIAPPSELRLEARNRTRKIIVNNDGCDILNTAPTREDLLKKWSIHIPDTQATTIFYCPIAVGLSLFSHRTKVGEFLNHKSVAAFHKQGIDPLETTATFAREHDLEIFFSLRMNDTHDNKDGPSGIYWSNFKENNPHLMVGFGDRKITNGTKSALDYSKQEVRDRVFAIIEEAVDNYDLDGVELDFFRHLQYFPSTATGGVASDEERAKITALVGKIREKLDAKEKSGKALLLAIRVPDSVAYCRELGLDIEEWMRRGWVDLLITTDYFQLNPWSYSVALARKHGVKFYAGLSTNRTDRWVNTKARHLLMEAKPPRNDHSSVNGRAMAALAEQADGIYLFNFIYGFPSGRDVLLDYIGDLTTARQHPRTYFVSNLGYRYSAGAAVSNGARHASLSFLNPRDPEPLSSSPRHLIVETGESPAFPIQATMHFHTSNIPPDQSFKVVLNGKTFSPENVSPNHYRITGMGPDLREGKNEITVSGENLPGKSLLLDLWIEVVPQPPPAP